MNTVYHVLRNEKYTGVYKHEDEIVDNMYPQIISKETFDIVQRKLKTYQRGKNSVQVTYLLRNKLRCGYCGQSVMGECGTARSGEKRYYYKCRGRKAKLNDCHKSSVPKALLETLVINSTIKVLSDPQIIDAIVKGVLEMQETQFRESSALNMFLKEKRQIDSAIENIASAIEQGVITKTTTQRLKEYEVRQEELEKLILVEQSKVAEKLTETDVREYYERALKAEPQMLINFFIKEIVMYDDHIEIHYNSPLLPTDSGSDENRGFSFCSKIVYLGNKPIRGAFFIG